MTEKPAGQYVTAAATALAPLVSSAAVVPRVAVSDPDWAPIARDCHGNVDEWTRRHPENKVVRGWLLMDMQLVASIIGERPRVEFLAHSVVRDLSGALADITPIDVPDFGQGTGEYGFIPHPGTDEDYEYLIATLQVSRIKLHTDGAQPQVTYDSI